MNKVLRGLAVLTMGAVVVTATAGIAAAKTISNEKYAKRLCGEMNGVLEFIETLEPSTTDDPAAYQQETLATIDQLIASMQKAAKKLKKLSPEDGGKKVTKLFDGYLNDFTQEFQDARDEFAAADPSSPAFTADVTKLGVALQTAGLSLSDPFAELSDYQDLLGAFGDERSCEEIVTVYGV